MAITATLVKELRERTGLGMMECKKALVDTDGDIDTAIENLRKSGQAKAAKKAGRIAAEGLIVKAVSSDGETTALAEVNCETDFVTKADDFTGFARQVAQCVADNRPADLATLLAINLNGQKTVEETCNDLVAKIGENINVRRLAWYSSDGGSVGCYLHGARIGVLVDLQGGDIELARDIAMHIAAARPLYPDADAVPQSLLEKEREIFTAQAADSGKPEAIIEKMVEGRLKKYLAETTLVGQPFVKDPDVTVGKLLSQAGATVRGFVRLEVGEGIEKAVDDFVGEVMKQAKGDA
ncbi:MAG: translation elongation factor Ts [Gammaproteobacteria bacterium]|nr:translation elongation factor Ts [Gammaproteobacteria bacterium]